MDIMNLGTPIGHRIRLYEDGFGFGDGTNLFAEDVPSIDPSSPSYAQSEMEKELHEAYRREDEIRKHVEQREDTAYSRAVNDMRSAGIDPNLVSVTPSASGGGITNASRMDMTRFTAAVDMMMQEIQNEFQMTENEKDRLHKTVTQVIDKVVPTTNIQVKTK